MGFGRRLYDIARAEILHVSAKFRRAAGDLIPYGKVPRFHSLNSLERDVRASKTTTNARRGRSSRSVTQPSIPQQIRGYYANLELSPEASISEVKMAYRRLMSRYHPDRHSSDPERTKTAHALTQQLSIAYEAILQFRNVR